MQAHLKQYCVPFVAEMQVLRRLTATAWQQGQKPVMPLPLRPELERRQPL